MGLDRQHMQPPRARRIGALDPPSRHEIQPHPEDGLAHGESLAAAPAPGQLIAAQEHMLGLAQRAGRGMVDIAIARAAQAPVGVEIGLGRRQGNVRGHEYIRICDDSRSRPPAYPKRQALRWLKDTPAGAICVEAAGSSCQRLTLGFMPTTQPTPTQAPPLDLGAAIDAAVSAAHTGAAILQSYAHHRADLVIDHKARNDLVSQADREAEAAILESLRERTPEFGIVAEETGG